MMIVSDGKRLGGESDQGIRRATVCHLASPNASWWVVACAVGVLTGVPGRATGQSEPPDSDVRTEQRAAPAADDDSPVSGTVRLGGEYDSNARRTELERRVDDVLMRYFAALDAELEAAGGARAQFDLQQGGKLFGRERAADALLTRVGVGYRRALAPGVGVSLRASMKDRFERRPEGGDAPHQDYNRGEIRAGVGASPGPWRLGVSGGWRYFAFRPNPGSSNHGPLGSIRAALQLDPKWRIRGNYTLSERGYPSVRLVRSVTEEGELVSRRDADGRRRRDVLHLGQLGFAFRGPLIVEGSYRLLINRSNSYGAALTRHGLVVDGTVSLPWQLYVSARVKLQRTSFQDPVLVSADLKVEEENRNAAVASLTRVFGEHWEVEARYRLYLEEFGADSTYRRQTVFLGTGYVF